MADRAIEAVEKLVEEIANAASVSTNHHIALEVYDKIPLEDEEIQSMCEEICDAIRRNIIDG